MSRIGGGPPDGAPPDGGRPPGRRPDEERLIEAAQNGDSEALAALLERHQPRIYRFGMKMCRDPEDAKDVLQDTMLTVARSVRDFRGASSLSTWLYSIARSFCIKKRRRSKFAPEPELSLDADSEGAPIDVPDPARGPEEIVAGRQIAEALDGAIAELEPMYREVLVLRDIEGLSAPEVSEVLGIGVDAVKSRLHRARIAVRARLAPLLEDAEPGRPAPARKGCRDIARVFSRHLEGEISGDLCTEMERHLGDCGRCRTVCDSMKRVLSLCRSAPAPRPPEIQESVRKAMRELVARVR